MDEGALDVVRTNRMSNYSDCNTVADTKGHLFYYLKSITITITTILLFFLQIIDNSV